MTMMRAPSGATTGARAAMRAGGRSPCIAYRVSRSRSSCPLHFLVLGQALTGAAALDAVLAWTERPWVKASEIALVFLLAAHLPAGCGCCWSSSAAGARHGSRR